MDKTITRFHKTKNPPSPRLRRTGKILSFIITYLKRISGIFSTLTIWEKRIIAALLIVILANSGLIGRRIFISNTKEIPDVGGVYTEGLVGNVKFINPLFAQTDAERDLVKLIFSGLTYYNNNREPVGDLAESWQVLDEGSTYQFKLRPNLFWHDGEPVTSDDVLFTISLTKNPAYQGPSRYDWDKVEVEKIDDLNLKFYLQSPSASFLSHTSLGILPSHLLSGIEISDLEKDNFNLNPIGCGPYRFENFLQTKNTESISLLAYENYHFGEPKIKKMNLNLYANEDDLMVGNRSGEILGISRLPAQEFSKINSDFLVYKMQVPQYLALFLNQKNPYLADKRIREALAYATDKEKILKDVVFDQGRVISGPILPGFLGYKDPAALYNYNPSEVRRILELISQSEKESLTFDLVSLDTEINHKIVEILENSWREFGIEIKPNFYDLKRLQKDYLFNHKYDILLLGENVGADSDLYSYWHSSQAPAGGLNLSNFVNKEADQLLEKAQGSIDPNERSRYYQSFQDLVAGQIPAIFLYQPCYLYAVNQVVRGVEEGFIITGSSRFNEIYKWYIKTKREKK